MAKAKVAFFHTGKNGVVSKFLPGDTVPDEIAAQVGEHVLDGGKTKAPEVKAKPEKDKAEVAGKTDEKGKGGKSA